MSQINAYLSFGGNAREAMTFYKECLGGELVLQTVSGSPIESEMPAESVNSILHSSLTRGGLTLFATDMSGPEGVTNGNNVSLMLDCESDEEARSSFEKLSAGGLVTCPIGPSFWGATFGHFEDKFGVSWLVHYLEPAKKAEMNGATAAASAN